MAYSIKERDCTTCGALVKGRIPALGDVHCIDCSVQLLAQAALEMHNKCGPAYDSWLQTRGPQGRPRTKT